MDMDMDPRPPWVSIHIRGRLAEGEKISIRDSLISEGEFHSPEDQAKALTEDDIDKLVMPSDGISEVCARGRRGSEGWMDLFHGESKICELHWDNRSKRFINIFEVLDDDDKYKIDCSGWSPQAGPLGHVYIDISPAAAKAVAAKAAAAKAEL